METCRTCAKCDFKDDTNWFDLFHTTRCVREIEEIRIECSNWKLQISQNDGLPQKICADCFSKFCNVYSFRLECQQAQVKLNNIFDKIETQSMEDMDDMEDTLFELERRLLQRQLEQKMGVPKSGEYEVLDIFGQEFSKTAIEELEQEEDEEDVEALTETEAEAASVTAAPTQVLDDFSIGETETETLVETEKVREVKRQAAANCYTLIEEEEQNATGNIAEEAQQLQVDDIIEEDFLEEDELELDEQEFNNNNLIDVTSMDATLEDIEFVTDGDGDADADDDENIDDAEHVIEAFEPVPTNYSNNNNNCNNKNNKIILSSDALKQKLCPSDDNEFHITFECKYCYKPKDVQPECFHTQDALLAHITAAHDSEYPFTCPQQSCTAGFRDAASRTVHMKNDHVPKHYSCDVCGKRYADRFNLRHHIEKFHSDTDFECGNCGKRFYSRKSLNYHMKWHQPELQLKCSHCDRLFISQRHLKCHEETHAGVRNSECCTFCGKTFIHLKTLRWHLYRQHGGEKPYKCGNCTEAFASYVEKRIHMLEYHLENLTANERTECMPCRQRFEHEDELVAHIRDEHLQRPKSASLIIANNKRVVRSKRQKHYSGIFQCDICTQRFNMKSALERHAAVHSSEGRPHMCPFASCAKRFKRAQDMNWHMKTHSNERPNICDVCGKGFALKYVLNQHKRSHEVLEKNFKCETCGRAYLFEKSLRVHERIHTGKTYYKCDLCGEGFVTHMKFKSHIKKQHDPGSESARKKLLDSLDNS